MPKQAKPTQADYPLIHAWGDHMGSDRDYILGEVEKARKDKAPAKAIYSKTDMQTGKRTWSVMDDVSAGPLRNRLEQAWKEAGE